MESYNIIGELNRIMQSSEGLNKLIRIFELKVVTNGVFFKIVLSLYLKSEKIPILWKKIHENHKRWRQPKYQTKKVYSTLS